jgi:hypothetical protein
LEKVFFNADYKSNSVILEGLNAVEMLHDLIEEDVTKELPLFNKLYNFFANKERELEFKFDDLIDL